MRQSLVILGIEFYGSHLTAHISLFAFKTRRVSGSPWPLYCACCGQAQSGRLRPGKAGPVATTASGALPSSTQSTTALRRSKLIECCAARAMTHARHQEGPARCLPHLFHAAGIRRHALVVIQGIDRREPGIAHTVIEQHLAAMAEVARQIGPVGGVGEAIHPARVDPVLDLIDVDAFPTGGPTGLRAPDVRMPGMATPSAATPLSHGNGG